MKKRKKRTTKKSNNSKSRQKRLVVPEQLIGVVLEDDDYELDWEQMKNDIGFAVIELGYGIQRTTPRLDELYIKCYENDIPVLGFIYIPTFTSVQEAEAEALHVRQILDGLSIGVDRPFLAFGWDVDSADYLKLKNIRLSPTMINLNLTAFYQKIKSLQMFPCYINNYTGISYQYRALVKRMTRTWGIGVDPTKILPERAKFMTEDPKRVEVKWSNKPMRILQCRRKKALRPSANIA